MNSSHSAILEHTRGSSILFILLNPLPYPGAAWTRIEYFANYLDSLGFKVTIAGAFSPKTIGQAGSVQQGGIKIYNIIPVITVTNLLSHVFTIVSSFMVSIYIFLLVRPRLVVISVPANGNALGCYAVARLFRCKVITDYRDEWEDFVYYLSHNKLTKSAFSIIKNIMTVCYKKSDAVIAVTEPLATNLKARGIDNVKVIPNGADLTVFGPKDRKACRDKLGLSPSDFILMFSGHIGGYYRVDIIVQALSQILRECGANTKLVIAGRGYGLESVLKLAEDLGIKEKVLYLGKIADRNKLVEALCASDVGIIPYDSNPLWKNSLPVKSLEYLACGLPIIATVYKDSLLGRMIIENQLGLVAEPQNSASLCHAIRILKADDNLKSNASSKGISIVNSNFNRLELASEFHEILVRCLDARKNQ